MLVRKISAVFMLTLGLLINSNAQQIFKVSQFVRHNYIYNPAAAGADGRTSVGAAYRKMWSGMPGGPQTTILYGDHYFDKMNTGVGVVLYTDKTGPTSRTGGQMELSYSIDYKDGRKLMFGLAGMFMQYRIDKSQFSKYIVGDPLMSSDGTEIKGDAAAGVYYRSNTLNIGFSAQQLMQTKLNFIKSSQNVQGKLYRQYYFAGHYNYQTDEATTLIPHFSLHYFANSPVNYEAGMIIDHKKLFQVGLGYHYQQSFTAMAGVTVQKNLTIGYAFQQYNTPLSVFDDGGVAHEVSLRYYIK